MARKVRILVQRLATCKNLSFDSASNFQFRFAAQPNREYILFPTSRHNNDENYHLKIATTL